MSEHRTNRNFDSLIVEAVRRSSSFFAWKSLGGSIEKCELKIKAYRKNYNEIELEVVAQGSESFAKVFSGNRILNIYVPDVSISFSSEVKEVGVDKKIKLYRPKDYIFHDRRKSTRYYPLKPCYLSFEYNKMSIKKVIHDISESGVSIVLSKSERITISKGKALPSLLLDLGTDYVRAKAECVNLTTLDRYSSSKFPYGGFKLAFRFVEMSEDDKALIRSHFVEEKLRLMNKKAQ